MKFYKLLNRKDVLMKQFWGTDENIFYMSNA